MRHSARCWAKWLLKTDARRRVGRRLLALSLSDNHDLKWSEESRTSRAVEPRAEQVAHVPAPTDRCGGTGACCSSGVLTQLERGRGLLRDVVEQRDAADGREIGEHMGEPRFCVRSFSSLNRNDSSSGGGHDGVDFLWPTPIISAVPQAARPLAPQGPTGFGARARALFHAGPWTWRSRSALQRNPSGRRADGLGRAGGTSRMARRWRAASPAIAAATAF